MLMRIVLDGECRNGNTKQARKEPTIEGRGSKIVVVMT